MFKKKNHPFICPRGELGAVQMEYVLLGVLLVAALAVCVVVFSRSLFRGSDMMGNGVLGDKSRQGYIAQEYRKDQENDGVVAKLIHIFITGGEP